MANLTIAVSENAFARSLDLLKSNCRLQSSDSTTAGPLILGYNVDAGFENGTVDLGADGQVHVRELDWKWNSLAVSVGLDIPTVCTPRICVTLPFIGRRCTPSWCFFTGVPDVSVTLDIAPFVRQEISFSGSLAVRRFDVSAPPPPPPFPWMKVMEDPDTDAWQIFLVPGAPIDIDLFDISDIVGDLLENALVNAVTALLPGGALRSIVLAIIGSVVDVIRAILDFPDDFGEWLSDQLNFNFDLLGLIAQFVVDVFGTFNALYSIADPYPVLEEANGLIPVRIPVGRPDIVINDDELILTTDIG